MTIYFDQPCTGTVESHFFGTQKKERSRFSRFQGHHNHLFWPTPHRYSRKSLFWHRKKREVPIFKISGSPWPFILTNPAQVQSKVIFLAPKKKGGPDSGLPWPFFSTNPAQVQSKVSFLAPKKKEGPDFQDAKSFVSILSDGRCTGCRQNDVRWIKNEKGDPLTLKKEKKNDKDKQNPITLHFIWHTAKHAQGAVKYCFPHRIDMRTLWFSKAKTVKLFPMVTWKTYHLEYTSNGERCAGCSRKSFSIWEQVCTVSKYWLIGKEKKNGQTRSATFTFRFEYSKTCTGWRQKLSFSV